MPQSPILVTGALGNIGRSVVDGLLAAAPPVPPAPPVPVRAADIDPDRIAEAFGAAVEAVRFDFTDPATWPAAFDGVELMFLMRPPHISNIDRDMAPALEAAKAAGVRHVVFLSLQGAETNKVVPHAKVEAWLRASGLVWTFVRPSFFMENLSTTHAADIRDRNEIYVPAGTGRTSFVAARDVAAVAVATLLDPAAHRDTAWTPTGTEALTYVEVAEILSDVLGRRITYAKPGALGYARHAKNVLGMPLPMVGVTTAIYSIARMGKAAGLTDDVRTVTGRDPITFRDWAQEHADAWQPARRGPRGTDRGERRMRIAVIGATGRTGTPLVAELLTRGHEVAVLARTPAKLGPTADRIRVVAGSSTDPAALADLVVGIDAVVSALGPTKGDAPRVVTATASALIPAMRRAEVTRFVGVSGAGIDVPGDRKGRRDQAISFVIRTIGGDIAKDKASEYAVWAGSDRDWTLVRPPRLMDGDATGRISHDAHVPGRSSIRRADLARFLADVVEQDLYPMQAPFVWNA